MDQVTDMFNVLSVPFREEADRDREPLEMYDQHFIPRTNTEDAFQKACPSQALDWMRNANLETVMRMLAYGKRFHTNPRYDVEIRITPVDNPQAEPAVLSLRPHGVVKTSPNVPLDPRNIYSHFSISHPAKDPSTLDDWQWLAQVAESLRARGMVLSRDGKDGPSMFDAITCPVAWLQDAKVVILADEMTGATEFHLASLRRSTVLLRAPSLTRKNIQILCRRLGAQHAIHRVVPDYPAVWAVRATPAKTRSEDDQRQRKATQYPHYGSQDVRGNHGGPGTTRW